MVCGTLNKKGDILLYLGNVECPLFQSRLSHPSAIEWSYQDIMTFYGPEFFYDGSAVGLFLGADGPRSPGSHAYEPYRGPGHYELQSLLRDGGSPRCYYEAEGRRVSFTVASSPEHGVLELRDFEFSPLGTA